MTKKDIKLYEKLVKITQDFEALIKEEDDKVIQPHFNEFELCSADVREALKLLNDAGFKVVKES